MKTTFRISFDVQSAEKIGTIIQVLAKEVSNFSVQEISPTLGGGETRASPRKALEPLLHQGCAKIVLDNISIGQSFTRDDMITLFQGKNKSPNSISPLCSKLASAGVLEYLGTKTYRRVK
jgi:hypothetical protein